MHYRRDANNLPHYTKYHHKKIFAMILGVNVFKDTLNSQIPCEFLDKLQSFSKKKERHTTASGFTLEVPIGRK